MIYKELVQVWQPKPYQFFMIDMVYYCLSESCLYLLFTQHETRNHNQHR